jgi:hypothetical protein
MVIVVEVDNLACIVVLLGIKWRTPMLLNGLNYESKGKQRKEKGVGVRYLVHNISGVEGHVGALGWD